MTTWGGRFSSDDPGTEARVFTSSFKLDQRFYRESIAGSIAHASMLGRTRIITEDESESLTAGLRQIRSELDSDGFPDECPHEDIYAFIEDKLHKLIGPVAGKLHTARSRNDQVATDFRLYVKGGITRLANEINQMRTSLLALARRETQTVFPGMTHLQVAQPILLPHLLLAYEQMLKRDLQLANHAYVTTDVSPLGAGALAGVPYPIDSDISAKLLGFSEISRNSIDAVSDRDFITQFLFAATMTSIHLSKLAEEIVVWNSQPYSLISIHDSYATGSSIMPQKKNPDVAELTRAKTGTMIGIMSGFLSVLKGLPLAYNLDLQEDKEAVFRAEDAILPAIKTFSGMVSTLTINHEQAYRVAESGFSTATDLADAFVQTGMTFRKAHETVGQIVSHLESNNEPLNSLSAETLASFAPGINPETIRFDTKSSIASRKSYSGTAPINVELQIEEAKSYLAESQQLWDKRSPNLDL